VPFDTVFAVHATRADDVGVVEIVFASERNARTYAAERSRDFDVLAASVTRFVVDELGTRFAIAWYVDGAEQPARKVRPGRIYPAEA
jgi:hypothetical protein